ncbi:MAS20-domain-containing protein [Cystobasidium minutum MCA 4210]|uniref:MAS20-domain-containing protein n=1 Tax=Cystobasidium minutum MCA 4210 TaxID=1397322 RepID=UPI0034CFC17F|eukprot:jgi/Rhomi1/165827/fgenesh1_kg.1_\
MVKLTPGVILGGAATTLAVGTIGYMAWFDYQRRNNVEFRRNLLKEKRKSEKAHQAQASKARASQSDALKNAVREMRNDRAPQSVEEREAYFLEQVAMGEALAAQGEAFYVQASIAFFKGLQVYPQPQELLMIYQRTQPAEVIALLMEALRLSIELEGSAASSGGASRGGSSSQQPRGGAILEEIDTEESATTASNSSSKEKSSNNGEDSAAQTNTSSPEARSYVDVDYPSSAASNA